MAHIRLAHEVGEAGAKRRRGCCQPHMALARRAATSHVVGEVE
jgi:hypothetical protein